VKTPVPLAQSLWAITVFTLSIPTNVLIVALAKTVAPLAQSTTNQSVCKIAKEKRLEFFCSSLFLFR
jgi:hypothetical protein